MTRIDREQTMFDAECMRLHERGRMTKGERKYQASRALRLGLDDSVVWMEPVEESERHVPFVAVVTPREWDELAAIAARYQ